MSVHFSSKTDQWATPQNFYNKVAQRFKFTLDVCADELNAKCTDYYTKEIDSLSQPWFTEGDCWMNPPYGREIGKWVKKAYLTSQAGQTVVCLLPSRTDTAWWHEYCMKGDIEFIRGRLKFGGSKNPAPFPSVLVIFRAKDPS